MSARSFISVHKLLTAFLAVIAVVIVSIAGLILYINQVGLKNLINSRGTDALGRDLTVGDAQIHWNWTKPRVVIKDLKISNQEGADDPYMIDIAAIDLDIKIWKLLTGELNLPEIKVDQPKLIFEKAADGKANWEFPAFSKANAASETVVPDDRHDFPMIGLLAINKGTIVYRDAAKKLDVELSLDTASGTGGKDEKGLKVSGKGKMQGQEFSLNASGGSIEALRDTNKDYPLVFNLKMGGTVIDLNGTFRDPVKLTGIDTTLTVQGHNLADLFYITGIPLPPSPPYKLTGQLKKKTEVWSYEEFAGSVGDSNMKGNLSYDTSGERGMVRADLTSSLLDMDDLGGFIGVAPSGKKGEAAAPEQKAEAAKQKASDKLLPDVQINLERLRAADMDVSLNATKVNAPGWAITSLKAHFDLKNGILKVDPMDLGIAKGEIDGSLVLDGSKNVPNVKTDLVLKRLSLKEFVSDSRFEGLTAGRFGGRIQLDGKGKSLAEVLSTSDGRITALMAGGQVSLLIVEAAGLDVAEASALLIDRDKTTHIRCAIGDFKVTDGILNSEAFVFDTNDTNLTGEAAINLKDETMRAIIKAHPKDPSFLTLHAPITISGRLKKPGIGVAPAELAGRGAAAAVLGVLLTPVAAIIPFIEVGLGEDSDCRGLIAQAQSKSGVAVPKN